MSPKTQELEGEIFHPSEEVVAQARLKEWEQLSRRALEDPEAFWSSEAAELEWYRKWDRVCDATEKPFYRWFKGGQCNIVHNCLDRHQKTWRKNKLALVWVGENADVRTYSYFALNREVCRFANVLKAMGVKKGDRVTIYMPRVPEIAIAMLACAKVGAIHSVVYGGFSVDSLQGRIEDSESRVVITADGGYMNGKIVELKKTVDDAVRRCPSVETVIVVQRTGHEVKIEPGRDYWYHDLMKLPLATNKCETEVMESSDPLYILYTSGTTGRPKGVIHPAYDPHVAFEAQKRIVEMWGFRADDVHLVVGPMYHTMPGAGAGQHLFVGATVVLMRRFDAEECLRLIAAERVTTAYMVPAHFVRLLEVPPDVRARYDVSSVRKVLHAAAPCPPDVKRRIFDVFPPGTVWEFYGATEGPGTIIGPDDWLRKPGSVGRPWPGITVKVLDDDGDEVPPGTVGTIYLSAPGGRKFRYHNAPEKTAKAFRDDFFTVGDLGHVDADGFLYVADRRADLILSGGVNVYPAEIESVLVTHPDVVDVAVYGVADPRWGQAVHAVVEPRAGSALDADALAAWCRVRMADYKCPRTWELVDRLPRDPNGKVLKRLLRERAS